MLKRRAPRDTCWPEFQSCPAADPQNWAIGLLFSAAASDRALAGTPYADGRPGQGFLIGLSDHMSRYHREGGASDSAEH